MELCYDGALVMPSNYSIMNEDEMTYVEGGFYISNEGVKNVLLACALDPIATAVFAIGYWKAVSWISAEFGLFCARFGAAAGPVGSFVAFVLGGLTAASIAMTVVDALWEGQGIEVGFSWRPYIEAK